MAKYGVQLRDAKGDSLYPRTIIEQIYNMAGSARLDVLLSTMRENLEGDIADTNVVVARLRADLDALLSDSTLSGEVLDAIVEIKTLLDSNSSDVVAGLVETMSALRDEAVRNVAQELTLSQKQQARQNIDAAGVSATYGEGLATISFNGNAIYPETKGSQVKLSIGGNAEDAIKANGGNIEKERVRAIAREDEIATELAETKEKVDTFLADADTSEQAIDKLKELQDYIKNDETSASQMLGDIAQNKNDIADNAEAIEKEATRAKQTEMYLESQKANKYGYYEGLSVGVSDNLSGRGEATESKFSFRPSGGENKSIKDGTARINSIKGNSVVWNCYYKSRAVSVKIALDDNMFVYRAQLGEVNIQQTKGDKIYICQTLNNKVDLIANPSFLTRTFGYDAANRKEILIAGVGNTFETNPSFFTKGIHTFATIHTVGDYAIDIIYCDLQQEDGITEYSEYSVKLVNLTKMFNGVNVPATVEEFEALYSNMPDEYNEGTIIDNHTSAIKSVGVNAWDEEWDNGLIEGSGSNFTVRSKNFIPVVPNAKYFYGLQNNTGFVFALYDKDKQFVELLNTPGRPITIPSNVHYIKFRLSSDYGFVYNHDICIHLVHTGYLNGKYFPYESQTRQLPTVEGGLKSAGTAYDEIRYNKGKDKWEHVQRVGSVDLGTLEWGYGNPSGNVKKVFYTTNVKIILGTKTPQNDSEVSNLMCNRYGVDSIYHTLVEQSVDKYVTIYNQSTDSHRIIVADTAYTDATTFKQAMQGVILNYELATPIVTELDVDISPDYKVWDYGTEEAISEVLSTPVRINTNYGFNAVGQITDNTELIKELLARVAVLEAQVAQANSTNVEPIEPVVE